VPTLRHLCLAASGLALAAGILACHNHALPTQQSQQAKAAEMAVVDSQRAQLELIPPPSKNRFMTVRSFDSWENPFITVQDNMMVLHIMLADPNPGSYGTGGMLRPVAARKQDVTISPEKLGEAIASIPASSWPYGRVIAIEEAHKTPKSAEPTVRRMMEMAIGKLNDLGIVVYDPNEGNIR